MNKKDIEDMNKLKGDKMKDSDEEEKVKESVDKSDVIEINFNFLKKLKLQNLRNNLWILVSIVLALALIFVFFTGAGNSGIGERVAGEKLISFINSQGTASVSLVSTERKGEMYEVTINADGQNVPILVTLDGKFAFIGSSAIPLSADGIVGGRKDGGNSKTTKKEIKSIKIGDSPVKGKKSANVTILEFSDYECPYCGKFFSETFSKLDKNFIKTGKVKFAFKDFPLVQIHDKAQIAAEAVRCVRDKKGDVGYFKMHNLIFEGQRELSEASLKKWALKLSVNIDSCLSSGKHKKGISEDVSYGQSLGVSGTPAFFIGTEEKGYTFLSGAQPYSAFEQVINSYIN